MFFCFTNVCIVIAYSDVVTTIPFENTIDLIELKGKYLLQAIEHGLSKSYKDNLFVGPYLLQVSGILNFFEYCFEVSRLTLLLIVFKVYESCQISKIHQRNELPRLKC